MTDTDLLIQNLRRENEALRAELEWKQKEIELARLSSGVTVQEWISVDDRLPEKSGLYITFGCTAVPVRWLHNFDKDMGKFGVWWDYDTDGKKHPRYRFIEAEDITHWMPLPSTEGLE